MCSTDDTESQNVHEVNTIEVKHTKGKEPSAPDNVKIEVIKAPIYLHYSSAAQSSLIAWTQLTNARSCQMRGESIGGKCMMI